MREWTTVPFEGPVAAPAPASVPVQTPAGTPAPPGRRRVFLAVPSYNGWLKVQAFKGLVLACDRADTCVEFGIGSLLARVFNGLYTKALNSRAAAGWSHFSMHHADIEAPDGWLDTILDEMDRVGADVLSAVVAIKDERRLSSTGVIQAGGGIRRLTLKEVARLPETFSADDLPKIGLSGPLVVNTGLWACRFDTAAAEDLYFTVSDTISRMPDGTFRPLLLPEDWGFSNLCNQMGLKVFATRKLVVKHHGESVWSSEPHPEGCEVDPGDF